MADEAVSVGLSADSKSFVKAFNEASAAVRNASDAGKALVKTYQWVDSSVHKAMNSIASSFKKMAAIALAGFAGVALAAHKGLSSFRELETAMANVSTVSDATQGSIGKMTRSILDMSTALPQTAEELAAGLYEVNSAGYQGAEALKVLETTAKFSTAGLTDMGTSVRATTALLHAYGMGAGQASHVTDVLFKAVEVGQMTATEFAMNIGDWASSAASLEVPFESAAAALANMTTYGALPANQAATSLNAIFRQLIRPSEEMSKALKRLGYSSGKTALQSMGLAETLGALWVQSGKNETAFQQMFQESEAFKGALGMVTNGYDNLIKIQGEFNDSTVTAGTTQRAFEKQMVTIDSQVKILKNNLRLMSYEVGTLVAPAFRAVVGAANGFLNTVNTMPMPLRKMLAALQLIGPALMAVGGMLALNVVRAKMFEKAMLRIAAVKAVQWVPGLSNFLTQMGKAGGVFSFLANNIKVFAKANMQLKLTMLRTAAQAMLTAAALTAFVIVVYSAATAFSDANREAKAWGEQINKIGTGGLSSMKDLRSEIMTLKRELSELPDNDTQGNFMLSGIAAAQNMSPWNKNTIAESQAIEKEILRLQENYNNLGNTAKMVASTMLSSTDAVLGAMAGLEQEGSLNMQNVIDNWVEWNEIMNKPEGSRSADDKARLIELNAAFKELNGQIVAYSDKQEAAAKAQEATSSSAKKVSEALFKIGDAASNADDRLSAYKDILDATLGNTMDLRDAEARMLGSLEEVGAAMRDNGASFDLATEKGRNLQGAFSSAGQAAEDYGAVIYEQTGDINEATVATAQYAYGMVGLAENAGWSSEQIAQMISIMGLTPEAIATLVTLPGIDPAIANLLTTAGLLQGIDGYTAQAAVVVSTYVDTSSLAGIEAASKGQTGNASANLAQTIKNTVGSIVGNIPKKSGGGGGGGGGGGTPKWKPSGTQLSNMKKALAAPLKNLLTGELGKEWQKQMAQQWYDQATANIFAEGKTRLGASILKSAQKSGEDPKDEIAGMVEAYNRLVKTVGKAKADIAINQFDTLEQFQDYVDRIEELVQHQQDVEDWKFDNDKMSYAAYRKILVERLKKYAEYSDEWMQLTSQLKALDDDQFQNEIDLQSDKLTLGEIDKKAYLDFLKQKIKGLKKYSDEYMSIWQEIQDLEQELKDEQLDKTNAVQDFADAVVQAFQDIKTGVAQPITDATNMIAAFGDQATLSMDQVQGYYAHMLEGTQRWVSVIRELKSKGINGSFLNQLIQAGPQSLGFAESVLALGDGGISFINDSMKQISDLANGLGTDIANGSIGTLNQNDNSVTITVGQVDITAEMPNGVTMVQVQDAITAALAKVATGVANHA